MASVGLLINAVLAIPLVILQRWWLRRKGTTGPAPVSSVQWCSCLWAALRRALLPSLMVYQCHRRDVPNHFHCQPSRRISRE